MSIRYKDYYGLLRLGRTASEEEIRRAYLLLARKFHPDMNGGDKSAEEKFKEISEAYEVLSDPGKRRSYDALGPGWKEGANFTTPPHWSHTVRRTPEPSRPGVRAGFSEFFEALFGGKPDRSADSPKTSGDAGAPQAEMSITLEAAHRGGMHKVTLQERRHCGACKGKRKIGSSTCQPCKGTGYRNIERTVDVNIPPGASSGSIIKIPRAIPAGAGRANMRDIYIRLTLESHPLFTLTGRDTNLELPVAPWEAILGAEVDVPTIDGRTQIRIPPGSTAGQRFRLRGYGMNKQGGGRGDAYVRLRIVVPENPTEPEIQLYREIARVSRFNPRPSDSRN